MKWSISFLVSAFLASCVNSAEPNQLQNNQVSPSSSVKLERQVMGTNLIKNSGAEEGKETPDFWTQDNWGENTAVLNWLHEDAYEGTSYVKVTMSDYQSGDAKWIFEPLDLERSHWYQYRHYYRSDGRSRIIRLCKDENGHRPFRTVWQTHVSDNWSQDSFSFYVGSNQNCKISLMHVLDRNGFLDSDQHQLVQIKPEPLEQPLVSITFDDIWATAATLGATELQKKGWRGSFYITEDFAKNPQKQYASIEQIKTLIASGHEVGTHGEVHSFLSKQTPQKIASELSHSMNFLSEIKGKVKGIAYPFGDFDHLVEQEAKRQYTYARTSLHGLNDTLSDPYRLKIFAVTSQTTTEEIKDMVDQAKVTSSWLIFLFHALGQIEDENTYLTDAQQYVDTLNYIEQQQLKVSTVAQGLQFLKR